MNYGLSGIKLNVNIGNQDKAKEELSKLIKQLESNKITIKVDFEDVKKQLDTITKSYEQSGKAQENAVERTQSSIRKIYKNSNAEIKSMVETQRKLLEEQYGNKGKINYTYSIDEFGGSNITNAFIEIKNQAQETEKVMFGLKESINTVGNEVQKIYTFSNTGKKELLNLSQADKDLDKFNNTVSNTRKKYQNEIQKIINKNSELASDSGIIEFRNRLEKLDNFEFDDLQQELKELQLEFNKLKIGFQDTGTLSQTSDNLFKRVGQYFTATSIYYEFAQAVRFGVSSIIELDDAMISLKKVTDESEDIYERFMNTANKMAINLGNSTKSIVDATAMYAQMGYTMNEAIEAANTNTIYSNVADVDSITAAEHLISIMRAFKIEAKDSVEILDKLNEVSNSYSVSASGLGEGLKRSASALTSAHNDLSKSVAMITAANTVVQDPELVGQALKSISMSLRGVSESTGELIPKFRELILESTNFKVDIWDEQNNSFKSTYDTMVEMSSVWDELSDKQRAFIASSVVGKHRSNVFYSLMEAGDLLVDVYETAENSAGSAYAEQEKFMESLSAKINELRENAVLLWQTIINEKDFGDMIGFSSSIVKGITDIIDVCGGITPILSLIISSIVSIKAMKISDGLISIGSKIGTVGKSIVSLMTGVKSTVSGLTAMQTAITGITGTIGLLGVAISGVIAYQNNLKYKQEEMLRVNNELAESYTKEASSLQNSLSQYTNIYKSTDRNVDKKEELYALQSKLREEFGLEKDAINLVTGEYEKQVGVINDLIGSKSKLAIQFADDALTEAMQNQAINTTGYFSFTNGMPGEISESDKEKIKSIAKEINDEFTGAISLNLNNELLSLNSANINPYNIQAQEKWLELLKSAGLESSNIYDSFKMMYSENVKWVNEVADKEKTRNNIIAEQIVLKKQSENAANGKSDIEKYNAIVDSAHKEIEVMEYSAETKEYLKSKVDELALKSFPGLEQSIDSVSDKFGSSQSQQEKYAKTLELLNKQFDEATDKAKSLDNVLEDIADGRGLTSDSMKTLLSDYPELLAYIDDESKLKQAVIEKIKEQEQAQEDSINYIRFLQSENLSQMENELETYFTNCGIGYDQDFNNYKDLENAKAGVTSELIKSLSNAWADYFGTISNSLGRSIQHVSDMSIDDYNNLTSEEKAKMKALENKQKKIKEDVDNIFEKYKLDSVDITLDGAYGNKKPSKSKKDSSIKDKFDKDVAAVQQARKQIEYEMELLQEKINLSELKGEDTSALADKMSILNQQKLDALHVENTRYEALKKVYTKEEQLSELESLMADNSKNWWGDKKSQLEHEISLIEKKAESIKRTYDDELKQLELQQILMEDNSQEYLAIEEEKLTMLTNLQKSYGDKIIELRKLNLSEESEIIKEYKNLYYDAEEERLNMIKSMAEKRKQIELDNLNKQKEQLDKEKSSFESYIKYAMDMLKTRYEEEKKMINDKYDLEEKRLKKQLDDKKNAIDAEKRLLQDEKGERDYNKGLESKKKEIQDIQNQMSLLEGVDTLEAQKKYEELFDQLQKKMEELNDYQYDNYIDKTNQALDDELNAYESSINSQLESLQQQKDEELKIIEDVVGKESKLREEAMKLIRTNNDKLYKDLMKWSDEYGKATRDDISDAWDGANSALERYNDSQMSALDTLMRMSAELKALGNTIDSVNNSSWADDKWTGGSNTSINNPTSSNNSSSVQNDINKMKSNSESWKTAKTQEERDRLSDENQQLGNKNGFYYDAATGVWYYSKDKKMRVYHTGIENGLIGGTSLKSYEELIVAAKGEGVFTPQQMGNINKVLKNNSNGFSGEINIEALMKVDRIDKDFDVDGLMKKMKSEVLDLINNPFKTRGMIRV